MPYTPVEVRHVRLKRVLFGYERNETDRVLDDIAGSFETVWRDRGELSDKVEELEKRLEEFKQREQLLSSTLVAAERAAADAREAARREAELILAEAHNEARSVTRGAHGERERLVAEARRVETLLRSALGLVEESVRNAQGGGGTESEAWPARQDTREFEAVSLPAPGPVAHPEVEPEVEVEADRGPEMPAVRDGEPVELPPVDTDSFSNGALDGARGRDFVWD